MKMKLKPGVITAMVTPFKNGKVDFNALRKNVKFQIENGVVGLLPLGTTGETPTLHDDEQEEIIKAVVNEAKGKVSVMVGTGTNSTEKTIKYTQKAEESGADAALVVTPYYNKPTNEGLYLHFKAVAGSVKIPIIVYNIAGRTGKNIETPLLKRIAEIPNIIGVKEASGDINQMMDVINTIHDFMVYSGDDSMTLPLMSLGGIGIISVVSNLVPKQVVEMVDAGLKGDFTKARRIHFELLPIFKGAFIETNPVPIKAAMAMKGMIEEEYRLPMCRMMEENKAKLRNILV